MTAHPAPVTGDTVWGVGRYLDAAGRAHLVAYSVDEIEREAGVAAERLESFGFGRDDILLVVAGIAEALQYAPYQRAARALGGTSCTAEPSPFDARRSAAFLEQYHLRAVIGLDAGVLDGLDELGVSAERLGACPVLIVRPDAAERVAAFGFAPALCVELGPALAVECSERAGAHVGAAAWTVGAAGDGQLWIEPARGRGVPVGRVITDLRGRVVTEPCACGSADPRVIIDPGHQAG